eukprot:TRINITY_DN16024_c0_g1_i1.p1 TRINITY_DN16024_c0_g1~~TRINITY_DN16024_c0_g1_i1.p1  ORF type:complete len:261 (+),score=43.77 TRINITY_DN16024_c0_g1_i1:131-913(+)
MQSPSRQDQLTNASSNSTYNVIKNFQHVGMVTRTASGSLKIENVTDNQIEEAIVSSLPSGVKSPVGSQIANPNKKRTIRKMTPRDRMKTRQALQISWESNQGILTLAEAQKIVKLYDTDRDGSLDVLDAKHMITDFLNVSGLYDEVMECKPLFKDEDSFLTHFSEIAFKRLDANQDDLIVPYDLLLDHGYRRFLYNTLQETKYELNPAKKTMDEEKMKPRNIDVAMMDYEYQETIASMLNKEVYEAQFAQSRDVYSFGKF